MQDQFSIKYRPKTFDEVMGQKSNVLLLKSILENPEHAPKSLVFQGFFGSGKTSLARIFARALNCKDDKRKPCGKCESCLVDIREAPYYEEYDSAIVGTVDRIKELRESFYYGVPSLYKVVVMDEIHLASRASQGALLTILESPPTRTFFIFATTDVQKILPTIVSRSTELVFEAVPRDEIIKSLIYIAQKEDIIITEGDLELIAYKSQGHMRNAHMLLDQYRLVGGQNFVDMIRTARPAYIDYFFAIVNGDIEALYVAIEEILRFPLVEAQRDFEAILHEIMKCSVGLSGDLLIKDLVNLLGSNLYKVVRLCMDEWVMSSFKSDINMQTMLLCLYQMFNGLRDGKKQKEIPKSRYARR